MPITACAKSMVFCTMSNPLRTSSKPVLTGAHFTNHGINKATVKPSAKQGT